MLRVVVGAIGRVPHGEEDVLLWRVMGSQCLRSGVCGRKAWPAVCIVMLCCQRSIPTVFALGRSHSYVFFRDCAPLGGLANTVAGAGEGAHTCAGERGGACLSAPTCLNAAARRRLEGRRCIALCPEVMRR